MVPERGVSDLVWWRFAPELFMAAFSINAESGSFGRAGPKRLKQHLVCGGSATCRFSTQSAASGLVLAVSHVCPQRVRVRLLVSLLVGVVSWRVSLRSFHACRQAIFMICCRCCCLVGPWQTTPKQTRHRVPEYIGRTLRRTKRVCLRHHSQRCCENNLRLGMATNP